LNENQGRNLTVKKHPSPKAPLKGGGRGQFQLQIYEAEEVGTNQGTRHVNRGPNMEPQANAKHSCAFGALAAKAGHPPLKHGDRATVEQEVQMNVCTQGSVQYLVG